MQSILYNNSYFTQRYNNITNYTIPYGSKYTHSYYDSVWSIALALNRTDTKLKNIGKICNKICLKYIYIY